METKDNEIVGIKSSLAENTIAMAEIKSALGNPSQQPPSPSGGSEVHAGLRPTPGRTSGASFAEVAASAPGQPRRTPFGGGDGHRRARIIHAKCCY